MKWRKPRHVFSKLSKPVRFREIGKKKRPKLRRAPRHDSGRKQPKSHHRDTEPRRNHLFGKQILYATEVFFWPDLSGSSFKAALK